MTSFCAFFFAPSFTTCSAMKMAQSSGVQLSLSARHGSALLFSGADSTCNDPATVSRASNQAAFTRKRALTMYFMTSLCPLMAAQWIAPKPSCSAPLISEIEAKRHLKRRQQRRIKGTATRPRAVKNLVLRVDSDSLVSGLPLRPLQYGSQNSF